MNLLCGTGITSHPAVANVPKRSCIAQAGVELLEVECEYDAKEEMESSPSQDGKKVRPAMRESAGPVSSLFRWPTLNTITF